MGKLTLNQVLSFDDYIGLNFHIFIQICIFGKPLMLQNPTLSIDYSVVGENVVGADHRKHT